MNDSISYEQLSEKPVINEFIHHNTSLLCWCKALSKGIIRKNSFLIFIDMHHDLTQPTDELITEFDGIDKSNLSAVKEFIEKKCRADNCEFLKLGMESGIIGDCLMIIDDSNSLNQVIYERSDGIYIYRDKKGIKHKIFVRSSTNDLEGNRGLFYDTATPETREFNKSLNLNDLTNESILLDIDLDYFSIRKYDWHYSLHQKFFDDFFKTSPVFNRIIQSAKTINLSLEPGCCGGKENCEEIREKLYLKLSKIIGFKIKGNVILNNLKL